MARGKRDKEDQDFVIEEDDEEVEVSTSARSTVKGGGVERYEVRIGPPMVSGRKVKPVRTPQEKQEKDAGQAGSPTRPRNAPHAPTSAPSISAASSQQLFKIEDDLRRTRDIVEDLKHNMSMIEGEVKDLRAETGRMSYLLRSLEGLKNTMTDMESTVSELSGLYDLISANINPFVDIPPLKSRNKIERSDDDVDEMEEIEPADAGEGNMFRELSDIFDDEEKEEQERGDDWGAPDLESEEWTLRWTKFLIEKVGREGLERTLDYYMDLGWIDEDAIEKVLEISRGTKGPKVKSDGKKRSWRMDADDHVKSLEYIKRMKSHRG